MNKDAMEYLAGEISRLLGARVSDDVLRNIIESESVDRLNNAIIRANKGESGALQFLKNCFPVEDARSRRTAGKNQQYANGNKQQQDSQNLPYQNHYPPVPEDDSFPADLGRQQEPPPQEQTPLESRPEKYFGHHVYGGKGALYFQANYKEKHDLNTVAIDAAPSAGIRKYDWNKKIRLQLTQEELPRFFAVVTGMAPFCKLSNHGPGNNKALEIHDQGGSLFVQTYAPGQNVAVKITPSDAFYVAQIIMRQMLRNAQWLDSTGVLNLVRMVVANRMEERPSQQKRKG